MQRIRTWFAKMVELEASDMFLRANSVPRARIHGVVKPLDDHHISPQEMVTIANVLLASEDRQKKYREQLDLDFIHVEPQIGRFRVNVFTQRGTPAVVARHVHTHTRSFRDLHLPEDLLKKFCEEPSGLVLLTGPAGNGKSTTIATMIEYINQTQEKHVVTIEDPIEFLFEDKKCIINQRELGLDVPDYPAALKHVTQQSPDIIYLGVIRDVETMHAAITATELGTLVFSTFHTINAVQTINRMVNFFPPHLHDEVRLQLSMLLRGIVSLRLLPRRDGRGRIPAWETMVVTPTIARLIRENNMKEIQQFIDEGSLFGMRSFRQSLVRLVKEGWVEEEVARAHAPSKDEFDLEMKGVQRFTQE